MAENERFIYLYRFSDGRVYVGQSKVSDGSYKRFGRVSTYKGTAVYEAMLKDPKFHREILEFCSEEEADAREIYYIELFDSTNPEKGYNKQAGGCSIKRISEEARRRLSETNKGSGNPMYGKRFSEEAKARISKSHKGRRHSEETKNKMSESHKGKVLSEDNKQKLIESHNKPCALTDLQTGERTRYNSLKELARENGFPYMSVYIAMSNNRLYKKRYKFEYI